MSINTAMIMLFAVGFIGAITPGPDMLLVARNTMLFGLKRGLVVLSGIAFGWIFYLAIIYFGLTHLLSNAHSQIALGTLGGLYLAYISANILRSPYNANNENTTLESSIKSSIDSSLPHTDRSAKSNDSNIALPDSFWRGLVVNLSNPKAILFFSVVVTQFIGQNLILSIAVLYVSLVSAFICVVIVASYFRKYITYKVFFIIDRISAVLFLFFAFSLFYYAFSVWQNLS